MAQFKAAGGGCLGENSTKGLQRRTAFLKHVSETSGVHVVAGTGFYVDQYKEMLGLKGAETVEGMTGMKNSIWLIIALACILSFIKDVIVFQIHKSLSDSNREKLVYSFSL